MPLKDAREITETLAKKPRNGGRPPRDSIENENRHL
jgi:hypothetical protein